MLSNGEKPWVLRGWSEDWTEGREGLLRGFPLAKKVKSTIYQVSNNDEVVRT